MKLADIQKLVEDDSSMQNLSKAQQQEYIEDLQIYRDSKRTGVRASNVAAALDCRGVVDNVSAEVCM